MLTPPEFPDFGPGRADDPRLHEIILRPRGAEQGIEAGRPVLVGFPVDEGVRRNGGRVGAALAPDRIRSWLYRLVPTDASCGVDLRARPPLDLGNLRPLANLEASQESLAEVVAPLLEWGAVPILLGGGHETAYGHYLAYCKAGLKPVVINLDAHLDVRPVVGGLGTSGTSFRQMMEHEASPLAPGRYACLGIQPHATSQDHWNLCQQRGDQLVTAEEMRGRSSQVFERACSNLARQDGPILLAVDADVVKAADVPGVSAPNSAGLSGHELLACVRQAGCNPRISSFELVEINPLFDLDDRGARWAATMVWQFLIGLAIRSHVTK